MSALHELHKHNIIHLDIKLENIVINETMKSFRFIDYGCCLKLQDYNSDKLYSVPVSGSPTYCSPEMEEAHSNGID